MRRHELLVESREGVLSLSPGEAAALRALGERLASTRAYWKAAGASEEERERTVIRCVLEGDGRYAVTVVDAVGLIAVDDLQIEVQPKIPPAHLLYLLVRSGAFPRTDAAAVAAAGDAALWELVATWYVAALDALLCRGLLSDYRLEEELLPAARGSVRALETAWAYYAGRMGVFSEFDEFDEDTQANRVLLAAARTVARSPFLGAKVRRSALAGVARMGHVGPLRARDVQVQLDRRSGYYRDALGLALHVLDATGRSIVAGSERAQVFLIRTPELVEGGIRAILAAELAEIVPVFKRGRQLPGSTLTMNPDLVFDRMAVGDVKYKLLGDEWARPDLYQVVTFATAYRVRHAAIVAFGPAGAPLPRVVAVGDVWLAPFCWDARAETPAAEAADRLADDMRVWVEAIGRPR